MRTFRCTFGVLTVFALLMSPIAPAMAQQGTPVVIEGLTILGPDEEYGGATRGEWDARWWQYNVSFPLDEGPPYDPFGDECGYGQHGPVFLLPMEIRNRVMTYTCVVPEGLAIYVPLTIAECSTVEPPPFFGRNEEELRACAIAATEPIVAVKSYINVQPVPDLEGYATTSPAFPLVFPEDNAFGVPAGTALAVSSTYGYIIAPPPPGEFAIHTSITIQQAPNTFVIEWRTVNVIVEAPQVIEPEATPMATPELATPIS